MTMAAVVTENVDPNLSIASGGTTVAMSPVKGNKPPPRGGSKKLRVSFSPKRGGTQLSPAGARRGRRRRSSSHFGGVAKKEKKGVPSDDSEDDDDDEDSDIEFTLDDAADIDG